MSDDATVQLFNSEYRYLYTVPTTAISHTPPANLNITRLVLCRNYRAGQRESCTMGASCKFVHVEGNVEELPKQQIHVNYAWRAASLVTYERLSESGAPLRVAEPNTKEPTEEIECGHVLRTEGSTRALEAGAAASHCAHFRYNRMCNLGSECNFIHAIHIDPTARDFQRAPSRKPMKTSSERLSPLPHQAEASTLPIPSATSREVSVSDGERRGSTSFSVNTGNSKCDVSSCENSSSSLPHGTDSHESSLNRQGAQYTHNPYSSVPSPTPM